MGTEVRFGITIFDLTNQQNHHRKSCKAHENNQMLWTKLVHQHPKASQSHDCDAGSKIRHILDPKN
jgi:hypothetical protein